MAEFKFKPSLEALAERIVPDATPGETFSNFGPSPESLGNDGGIGYGSGYGYGSGGFGYGSGGAGYGSGGVGYGSGGVGCGSGSGDVQIGIVLDERINPDAPAPGTQCLCVAQTPEQEQADIDRLKAAIDALTKVGDGIATQLEADKAKVVLDSKLVNKALENLAAIGKQFGADSIQYRQQEALVRDFENLKNFDQGVKDAREKDLARIRDEIRNLEDRILWIGCPFLYPTFHVGVQ